MNGLQARGAASADAARVMLAAATAATFVVWALLALGVLVRWLQPPGRYATGPVDLAPHGLPGITLQLTYPSRLEPGPVPGVNQAVIVFAGAQTADDVQGLTLALALDTDAVYLADAEGRAVPARLDITPGYPDPVPHTLYLVHGNTQVRSGLLFSRRLQIRPILVLEDGTAQLPGLNMQVTMPSLLVTLLTGALISPDVRLLPYVAIVTAGVVGGWLALYDAQRRRSVDERRLRELYSDLEKYVGLGQWSEAREVVERIEQIEPEYKDVPLLEHQIRSEEGSRQRREALFRSGVEAYRRGEWREAARVFAKVEADDPYYQDVHYMRRTAALYADLSSRDRSRRASAAQQLGEVGDLVCWDPLIDALGDPSPRVAEAAERAFQQIGPQALEVLLGCLRHPSEEVRARGFRLIKGYGRAARDGLLGALRSSDLELSAQVATLLHAVGGRSDLAEALLWADERHVPGIVAPLVGEGVAATSVLIDVLRRAPEERVGVVLGAIAALKAQTDISRPLEEALRAAHDDAERARVERAMRVPPGSFVPVEDRSAPEEKVLGGQRALAAPQAPEGSGEATAGLDGVRRQIMRLFDRSTS